MARSWRTFSERWRIYQTMKQNGLGVNLADVWWLLTGWNA